MEHYVFLSGLKKGLENWVLGAEIGLVLSAWASHRHPIN